MYKKTPVRRYELTLAFLQQNLPAPAKVLDLGVRNPFSEWMEEAGYEVVNTEGEDLDFVRDAVKQGGFDAVTAFEILEHVLNPLPLLSEIEAPKLIATIPMRLWFAPAYQSKTDPWDRHYHEFEDWQFDWLLEKAGWEVKDRQKWTSPSPHPFGIRPLLRQFTPRYYGVACERSPN
ncbi:class I SAM-dependent methyltransferase [Sanyastnella coralliicola]|uniref:class I SAM-dependent methyltransferase n=1 Tax=Sanyastnella coralliicola TaxID=3069118 RepID=UPI0027BA8C7A|nr:methyltransferase domain-containing protein [Longitalea sp. SCSIO 12813]